MRSQALAACLLLVLVTAVDVWFVRPMAEEPEERLSRAASDQHGDVVWPERAFKALVVEMTTDPENPLGLSPAERLEALRQARGMEDAARRTLWASTRLMEGLDAERLGEVDRLRQDLRARALLFRHTFPALVERAMDALRSRVPGGRVAEPRPLPPDWDPDRDEQAAWRLWREKVRSWRSEQATVDWERDPTPDLPSTEMLDVSPQEILAALDRLQDDRARALAGAEAARAAGYVAMMGEARAAWDAHWERLHRLTRTEERTERIAERQRQEPEVDDLSLPALADRLRSAGRPR